MKDSPSLRRHLEDALPKIYRTAVRDALRETELTEKAKELGIPAKCPYTVSGLLEGDLNALRDMLA